MKSEMEMQTALAGLVLLMHAGKSEDDRMLAKNSADMLMWVLGYPNEFDIIFDNIKALEMPMDSISEGIKGVVAKYKPDSTNTDTITE